VSGDAQLRSEIIMRSAELRLDLALQEARRALFGDAAYHEELRESDRIDRAMRKEPPPSPPENLPGWKRHRWALRLSRK
jgi:hypothetical protein